MYYALLLIILEWNGSNINKLLFMYTLVETATTESVSE